MRLPGRVSWPPGIRCRRWSQLPTWWCGSWKSPAGQFVLLLVLLPSVTRPDGGVKASYAALALVVGTLSLAALVSGRERAMARSWSKFMLLGTPLCPSTGVSTGNSGFARAMGSSGRWIPRGIAGCTGFTGKWISGALGSPGRRFQSSERSARTTRSTSASESPG